MPGTGDEVAEASTPGSARSSPSISSLRCASCGKSLNVPPIRKLRTRLGSNPGSTRESSWKLRIRRPAPASSTTDSATCTPTNNHCSECRAETCVRRAAVSAPARLARALRIAGARPHSMVTTSIEASV